MKHSRSSAEVEIRDAVVKRFRELWPNARIIHEMNVEHGSSRADVVAVQPDRLWICEIKSERDKLDRLAGQIRDFGPACHGLIVAAHERWIKKSPGDRKHKPARGNSPAYEYTETPPSPLDIATAGCSRFVTWCYPEPSSLSPSEWSVHSFDEKVPWPYRMLSLLWSDEIRAVAAEHRVQCTSRTPGYKLTPDLSPLLTGREIERAVCKHLRARPFAEADAPIEIERKIVPPHAASIHRQERML